MKRITPTVLAVTITVILTTIAQPLSLIKALAQQETCRTFPETGRVVCGKFLSYWQKHGGVPVFGYPVSNPFRERSELDSREYTVQYFERAIFELHPENKPPYDVQLSLLGSRAFDGRHPNGEPVPPYSENLPLYPGARNVKVVRAHDGFGEKVNVTTFVANAKPDGVLIFYKKLMPKSRWALEVEYVDRIEFLYPRQPNDPIYIFVVEVKAINKDQTQVTLTFLEPYLL